MFHGITAGTLIMTLKPLNLNLHKITHRKQHSAKKVLRHAIPGHAVLVASDYPRRQNIISLPIKYICNIYNIYKLVSEFHFDYLLLKR
jgi:hypothetical protein